MRRPALLAACLAGAAAAQNANEPLLGCAFPPGLPRGATAEVVLAGRGLQDATVVRFSRPGVTAKVTGSTRPLTGQERTALREEVQKLQQALQGGTIDDAGRRRLPEIRRQLQQDQQRMATPQLAETVTLAVTVATDALPGTGDLRLATANGFSNPLRFVVGDVPETREREPNDATPDAAAAALLPVVISGHILPGDRDRFVVHLRPGERLVATVQARALIPYLADAVPGWFQATLRLCDPSGREVAYDDDRLFDPDPQLAYVAPSEGDYELEVRDALWRGRDDFVYRLDLRTGAPPVDATARTAAVPLGPFPPLAEREPDDTKETAQAVPLPRVVVGRSDRPGDVDVYAFEGHAGQAIVAEILARRLGSPFDGLLRLLDPQGRQVAVADDHPDPGEGLLTHQADPWLSFRLTMQGTWLLQVRDVQGKGGDDYLYRLRLGPPQPDFALRVVPSAVNLRPGTAAAVTVRALRQDGFAGPIALQLVGDSGCSLDGGTIPAGVDVLPVTISAPPTGDGSVRALRLVGTARCGEQPVQHDAVPADDRMQAFAWHHLVPADEFLAVVRDGAPPLGRLTRRDDKPLQLKPGATTEVVFDLLNARRAMPEGVRVALREPPAGITVAETRVVQGSFVVVLKADKAVKPGLAGNLLLEVSVDRPGGDGKQRGNRQRLGLLLPAIPFALPKG